MTTGRPKTTVALSRTLSRDDEVAYAVHAERYGTPMQHPAWLNACLETFGSDADVQLITVTGGESKATAPLVRHARAGFMELPGVSELYEPMDFMYSDPSALTELSGALVHLRSAIFLRRMLADSPVIQALRNAYGKRGLLLCRPVAGYPWIPLSTDWREPASQLSSSRASDLRRAQRRAARMGTICYQVLSPPPESVDRLLEDALQVELRSWKGRQGSDLGNDPVRGPFFQRFVHRAAQRGILRMCFLRIGGCAAAMQLAVVCGGRFWLLKTSYDEAFARCSPGILLLLESLRYATSAGLSSFEFLGTVEPWTRPWTHHVRQCASVRAYPARGLGLASLAAEAARVSFKRMMRFAT